MYHLYLEERQTCAHYSECQVSYHSRTTDFESYQLITFANRRQVWSIHTR